MLVEEAATRHPIYKIIGIAVNKFQPNFVN